MQNYCHLLHEFQVEKISLRVETQFTNGCSYCRIEVCQEEIQFGRLGKINSVQLAKKKNEVCQHRRLRKPQKIRDLNEAQRQNQ